MNTVGDLVPVVASLGAESHFVGLPSAQRTSCGPSRELTPQQSSACGARRYLRAVSRETTTQTIQ
jgi:hypothetical protein